MIKIDESNIQRAVTVLHMGKAVVFPTDTSYGLAVDATNPEAVKKLYSIKGRSFKKPVHIVVASIAMAKKYVQWGKAADVLAKAFWPGALTLVLPVLTSRTASGLHSTFGTLTAGTGFLGVRMPNNAVALSLVKRLKAPITATSANLSQMPDCYAIPEVVDQYKRKRNKPDILIDRGTLSHTKPSTVVKIERDSFEILRVGPISEKKVMFVLKQNGFC